MFEEQDPHKYALLWFEEYLSLIYYAKATAAGYCSRLNHTSYFAAEKVHHSAACLGI